MKKSALIATCLFNSSMVTSIELGERIVRDVFDDSFEGQDFSKWDSAMPDKTAKSIIDGVGRAMRINVRKFITDLSMFADQPEPNQDTSTDSEEQTQAGSASNVVESFGKQTDGRS